MATLLEPRAGRVEIDGLDVVVDPDKVRRIIGYMPDHSGVYERITVREYLEFFAAACRVDPAVVGAVIELTDLGHMEHQLVAALSKGMRQRLQLSRVLLHDPKVLILDEPASDLDPRARIEIRDLLLELRDLGKTIFLSSHILSELSDVCSSVGIIEKGELLVAGPIGHISERLAERRAQIEAASAEAAPAPGGAVEPSAEPPQAVTMGGALVPEGARRRVKVRVLADSTHVLPLIAKGGPVLSVDATPGGWIVVHYVGDDRFVAGLVQLLVMNGFGVAAVEPEQNELERIFLEVTQGNRS
jgi:ABC-2 type transport system ATP-binding protein